MKKLSLFLVAALTLAVCSCGNGRQAAEERTDTKATLPPDSLEIKYAPKMELGSAAPDFTARDTAGNAVSLSDFRGDYVVLDFWATWCGDCRGENATLKEVYSEYKDRKIGDASVKFVSYSFDHEADAWKSYIAAENIEWIQVSALVKWHDNPVSEAYQVGWIPTFYVIDPEGKIIGSAIKAFRIREILESR